MSPDTAPRTRVLHLDHTVVEGGAEYALQRMFEAGPEWEALLLLPPTGGLGVYARTGSVPVLRSGVHQPAGVSGGGIRVLGATMRLVVQAIATRLHPGFRTADVVDANTARAGAYGALAALLSRIPFVVHLRDMTDRAALGGAGYALMTRVVLPRADGVIADTRATMASARPFLRTDAVTAVVPSASGLRAHPAPPTDPPGPLHIGMLARLDPWKGQAVLLDAFAAAFGDSDAVLEFAGGAPFGHEVFAEQLRQAADRLGVGERVVFLGHVDDVATALSRWHIAVHASTRPEPLGQNVLQYLASGRATIVADEGGPIEFVDDGVNGLRVTPRDPAVLADALLRLANDPGLRARLGAAATATPGMLSDEAVVAAHAEFYADVVDRVANRRAHRTAR